MHVTTRCILVASLLSSTALATVPTTLTHSGYISYQGSPVEGELTLTYRLYDGASATVAVWEETSMVTCTAGAYHAVLGASTMLDADTLHALAAPYLGLAISGGQELQPRLPVTSVPYALAAGRAATADDIECAGCIGPTDVNFGYAGSATGGGAANDVACDDCISNVEIQNSSITTSKLADEAVTIAKLDQGMCDDDEILLMTSSGWQCSDKLSFYSNPGEVRCYKELELIETATSYLTYEPDLAKKAELFTYGWLCWNRLDDSEVISPLSPGVVISNYWSNWTAQKRVCGRINHFGDPDSPNDEYIMVRYQSGYYHALRYLHGNVNAWHGRWDNGTGQSSSGVGTSDTWSIWICR